MVLIHKGIISFTVVEDFLFQVPVQLSGIKAPHAVIPPRGKGSRAGVSAGSNPNQAGMMNHTWSGSFPSH